MDGLVPSSFCSGFGVICCPSNAVSSSVGYYFHVQDQLLEWNVVDEACAFVCGQV